MIKTISPNVGVRACKKLKNIFRIRFLLKAAARRATTNPHSLSFIPAPNMNMLPNNISTTRFCIGSRLSAASMSGCVRLRCGKKPIRFHPRLSFAPFGGAASASEAHDQTRESSSRYRDAAIATGTVSTAARPSNSEPVAAPLRTRGSPLSAALDMALTV